MCGIVYGKRTDRHPIAKSILKRFEKQKKRGTDGFGYISVNKEGMVEDFKQFEAVTKTKKALGGEEWNEIMFHHRYPTSTPNLRGLNHPIKVSNDMLDHDYYVIHNGVIYNDDYLKTEFEKLGFQYTTEYMKKEVLEVGGQQRPTIIEEGFNDSESLAIDLALFLDGKKDEIQSRGSIAFVCYKTTKEGKVLNLIYGRNTGNPLMVEKNGSLFFLKSEGQGKLIDPDTIYVLDHETMEEVDVIQTRVGYHYAKSGKRNSGMGYDTSGVGDERLPLPSGYDNENIPYVDADTGETYWPDSETEVERMEISEEKYAELEEEYEELKSDVENYKNELAKNGDGTYLEEEEVRYFNQWIDTAEVRMKEIEQNLSWMSYISSLG